MPPVSTEIDLIGEESMETDRSQDDHTSWEALRYQQSHRRWRNHAQRDLVRTAVALLAIWLIWTIGTSEPADGANIPDQIIQAERLGNAFQATPTTVPFPGIEDARCPQWWETAASVGWPVDELPKVDHIMFGESSCNPSAWVVDHDDTGGGLMGINIRRGNGNRPFIGPMVDWDWSRLKDPAVNLTVGLAMAENAERLGQCRWWPWTTRDRAWCR
jgi:hypothetical protein